MPSRRPGTGQKIYISWGSGNFTWSAMVTRSEEPSLVRYMQCTVRTVSMGSSGMFPVEIQFLCTDEYYGADPFWRVSEDVYVP